MATIALGLIFLTIVSLSNLKSCYSSNTLIKRIRQSILLGSGVVLNRGRSQQGIDICAVGDSGFLMISPPVTLTKYRTHVCTGDIVPDLGLLNLERVRIRANLNPFRLTGTTQRSS